MLPPRIEWKPLGQRHDPVAHIVDDTRVLKVAEHLRTAVMSRELVKRSSSQNLGRVTVSIGVANYRQGDSSGSLIDRADGNLYAAKRGGRNRVVSLEAPPEPDGGASPEETAAA